MATRDKTGKPRKAAPGKTGAKATGKSAPKKASRKATKAAPKTAPKTPASGGAKKVAVRRAPARPPIEILARDIVRAARDLASADLRQIYAQDATSTEPTLGAGATVRGLLEIRKKKHAWQDRVKKETWTPRRVFAKGNTICIVWQAELVMRDNRKLTLDEVAIHEVKNGRVVAERFYYDPNPLDAPKKKRKARRKPPPSDLEPEEEEEGLTAIDEPRVIVPVLDDDEPESPIDPIDL